MRNCLSLYANPQALPAAHHQAEQRAGARAARSRSRTSSRRRPATRSCARRTVVAAHGRSRAPARAFRSRSAAIGRRSTAAATSRAGSSNSSRGADRRRGTASGPTWRRKVRPSRENAVSRTAPQARAGRARHSGLRAPEEARAALVGRTVTRAPRTRPQARAPPLKAERRAQHRAQIARRFSADKSSAAVASVAHRRPRRPRVSRGDIVARRGRRARPDGLVVAAEDRRPIHHEPRRGSGRAI